MITLDLLAAVALAANPPLVLTQDEVVPSLDTSFLVTGARAFHDVEIWAGVVAMGRGPCLPALEGLCLDLRAPHRLGTGRADLYGTVQIVATVPAALANLDFVSTQAVSLGLMDQKSYVISAPVLSPALELDLTQADATLRGVAAGNYAGHRVATGDLDGDGIDEAITTSYWGTGVSAGAGAVYVVADPAGTIGLGSATATLQGVAASDHAGTAIAVSDFDGDGFDDVAVGAPDADALGRSGNGVVYLVHGPVAGATPLSGASTRWIGAGSSDNIAFDALEAVGDIDGNGVADLAIGAPSLRDALGNRRGTVYLVPTDVAGPVDLGTVTDLIQDTTDSRFGAAVARLDANGDGAADLLVGAPGADIGFANSGSTYLFLGPISGTLSPAGFDARLDGERDSAMSGGALAHPVDYDGDGLDDLVIASEQGTDEGVVRVVLSSATGIIALADAAATWIGEEAWDLAGDSVATVPDVDGDGRDELLVGATSNGAGAAYFVRGGAMGGQSLAYADLIVRPEGNSVTGVSVGAGDVDGDLIPDLLIGSSGHDGAATDAGAVHIFSGSRL